MGRRTVIRVTTGAVLAAAALVHAVWGRGSTFPFRSYQALTDNVVGSPRPPSPAACYAVAGLLTTSSALVVVPPRTRLHRLALWSMSLVFGVRALAGFTGRTDALVPGSNSPTFKRNDRFGFAPLCAAIAIGVALTAADH